MTERKLRRIIREEAGQINEAGRAYELQDDAERALDELKELLQRNSTSSIAATAADGLTERGMEKFVRKITHAGAQIHQAVYTL